MRDLQVNNALSPELNWLFTWVRWAGLVPGSSMWVLIMEQPSSCLKWGSRSDWTNQPKKSCCKLHSVSPSTASFSGATQGQSRRQTLPQAVPGNQSRSLKMLKNSISFQEDWKLTAPGHQMVLVFHWTAQRKLSDEALLKSYCWCLWICTFPSVFLHLKGREAAFENHSFLFWEVSVWWIC